MRPRCVFATNRSVLFSARRARRATPLGRVKLGIVAKDALLVEGNAARGPEIRGNAWPRRHAIAQRQEPGNLSCKASHRVGKGIRQALYDLKGRQIDVRKAAPEQRNRNPLCDH